MKLYDLIKGLEYSLEKGNVGVNIQDIEVEGVQYDSRKIKSGDLFICIEGFSVDGHNYAKAALGNGATVIVVENTVEGLENCTVIKVKNTRKALAVIASNFYGNPSKKMKIIGITGTNGKTTSTYMMKVILEEAGFKVGLIGTIANYIMQTKVPANRTTPESLELHKLFSEMVVNGVDYCIMEVSSHSLALDRVYGIEFSTGVFSNLTQDHLDFHKTFEEYYKAKLVLFKNSLCTVVNIDDEYGRKIMKDILREKFTYTIDMKGDLSACDIKMHSRGIDYSMIYKSESYNISLKVPGRYNVYNSLSAAAACIVEGIDIKYIKAGLGKVLVPGRCEIVTEKYNLGFEIIVDYAHTPDGLENILNTCREFTKGRLISVFGCGGDRDRTKRPIMGEIGSTLSDIAIITSDNPRSESPNAIIEDIVKGVNKDNYIVIENRREAIKKAINIAEHGDVIVIAGKGHEDYQEIKGKTIHFDEREIIKEIIEEKK